jgi:HlyD family secretion protein
MAKRKKKGKLKWIIILVVVLALAVAGMIIVKNKSGQKGTEVTVGESSRGNITSVVTATGKIFPVVEVRISSEVAGEIVELPVADGMVVQRGDVLVRVNPDTLEAQVKQQEAALSASKANAAQAKAQLLKAELDLSRTQNMFERGFATQQELDQTLTSVEVARASHEASVFRIEQQDMQLKEARDSLNKATTYAPISGTITALNSELGDRVVGTGQFAGTEIMRLADLTDMEVRVDVSEAEIVDVKINDQADIEIDAFPNEKFTGVVTVIANSAKTSGSGSQEQLTTFQVRIRLEKPDARYRPGMTATADIKTKTAENVVLVPLQSVTVRPRDEVRRQLNPSQTDTPAEAKPDATQTRTGAPQEGRGSGERGGPGGGGRPGGRDSTQRIVFMVQDGKAIMTPVETGIADSRNIEITSGLEENVKIVTGSYGVLTRTLKHESAITEKAAADNNRMGPNRN